MLLAPGSAALTRLRSPPGVPFGRDGGDGMSGGARTGGTSSPGQPWLRNLLGLCRCPPPPASSPRPVLGTGWRTPVLHLSVGLHVPRGGHCHGFVPAAAGRASCWAPPWGTSPTAGPDPASGGATRTDRERRGAGEPGRAEAGSQMGQAGAVKAIVELPGCGAPPAAGSVPWPGSAGRGAAGSALAFAS